MAQDRKPPKRDGMIDQWLAGALEHHRAGRLVEAEALYARILRRDPPNHAVINLTGLIAFQRGEHDKAVRDLARAATIAPRVAKYRYDLGVVEQSRGANAAAAGHYAEAVRLEPSFLAAWENQGVARFDLRDNAGAVACFEHALQLNRDSLLALGNLATLRRWQGRHGEALALLDRALALDPLDASLRMKRGELLLATGDYARGWDDYAWRAAEAAPHPAGPVPLPKWNGAHLAGRHVVVHAEQGVGDEVMFAGCLPDLLATGARVTLLCDPRLAPGMARSFPAVDVRPNLAGAWGAAGETVAGDVRAPVGDLAAAFRRADADFARQVPYLQAAPTLREGWRRRLADLGPGRKIGLTWRGGSTPRTRQARSIALAALEPLLGVPDLRWVSLQYGAVAEDIATLSPAARAALTVFPDLDPVADLEPFLALVAELDLVVTVDNSTVHFAGALGVPAWLLLPALPDWRWPATGETARWYGTVRLFRQPPGGPGEWGEVLAAVRDALDAALPPGCRPPTPAIDAPRAPVPAATTGTRVLLLNDTSAWYHWGCSCTSLALREGLKAGGALVHGVPIAALVGLGPLPSSRQALDDPTLYEAFRARHGALLAAIEQADEVVINGEGTLHGATTASIGLLYLAWLAGRRLGRPVRIVNHSCYPDDSPTATGSGVEQFYRAVYESLAGIAVREPVSAALVESWGLRPEHSFDCLPLYVAAHAADVSRDPAASRLLVAGSVAGGGALPAAVGTLVREARATGLRPAFLCGSAGGLAADDRAFARVLAAAAGGPVEVLHATSEAQFLSAIASARLLVSGRFHYSIAAAVLGTPFIALDSNTPKMDGLMAALGIEARLDSRSARLEAALRERVAALLDDPASARVSEASRAALRDAAGRNFAVPATVQHTGVMSSRGHPSGG